MNLHRTTDCSVIIPFHSNTNLFQACISTLVGTLPDEVEVIVVANNAQPQTLPELPARVRTLVFNEDLGYSRAVNVGADAAHGRLLVLCDADTFYFGEWLEQLTACHRAHPDAWIVGTKLLDPATGRIAEFGHAFSGYNFAHLDLGRRANAEGTASDRSLQSVCSASMLVERHRFLELGGYDESLFNFYSDVDLCLRVRAKGGEVWAAARAVVYHRGNSTLNDRAVYQADVKGRFMMANAQRLHDDLEPHLRNRLREFVTNNPPAASYLLVDLCSVVNRGWFRTVIADYLRIVDTYEYRMQVRDAPSLELLLRLGLGVASLRVPIVYFVDRFLAVAGNEVWCKIRAHEHDVVVDRNGTVVRFRDVVAGIA
jgi:GT2 family glycosyltransferase